MIDTHCHVDFEDFDKDREEVIKRAKDKLDAIINSGTGLEGNKTVLDLAKKHKGFLYPSLGYHPVTSESFSDEDLKLAQDHMIENIGNFVAIGEVGMDFFYVKDKAKRARQRSIFISFVELASEYQIPLLIHARDCDRKAFNIVKEYPDIPEVIFHCYGGSLKTARRIIDEGYYISFSEMVCFSNHHQDLAKEVPFENMLTETDSPYLAVNKEDRNEPAFVEEAVKKIAEIREVDFSEVDKITTNNAKKVFKI